MPDILPPTEVKPTPPPSEVPAPSIPEITTPPVPEKKLSTKQEINTALEEVGKQMLDRGDPRVGVVALARLVGDSDTVTPMGQELRQDIISTIQTDSAAPESIKNVKLPDAAETKAFEAFLQQHPDAVDPKEFPRIQLALQAGTLTIGELSNTFQKASSVREPYLTALLGENHPKINSFGDILHALHIDPTEANQKQLTETFKADRKIPLTTADLWQKMLTASFTAVLMMQFGQSLAAESSSHGH